MNRTDRILAQLRRYESPNVLFIDRDGSWPVVWERARGVHVWDVEGRKYLDLTAAFGVAAGGHANPRVVWAGAQQMRRLLHAMGDVHPHAAKANLAQELSRLTFERWHSALPVTRPKSARNTHGKTIFCNSGFEAVEAALKTAYLATGRRGVIAFEGGYHGLGYGALNLTHREQFRQPFAAQLGRFGHFLPWPMNPPVLVSKGPGAAARGRNSEKDLTLEKTIAAATKLCRRGTIGAILIEPIQSRGGIRIPHPALLPSLRQVCDEHDVLLIVDEIYTGFGRTGRWFGCEHFGIVPDLVCLGKALTGGFPLSACVGRADLIDHAWPASQGEALHTSTFLGHPVGCAMALAQIANIRAEKLVERSDHLGRLLRSWLTELASIRPELQFQVQGLGLMNGLIWRTRARPHPVMPLVKEMLKRGFILLPEGAAGEVLALTPPLTITERQLRGVITALAEVLSDHVLWP